MIWLILAIGAVLAALVICAEWRDRRARRRRENLRHITEQQWWGKR